MVMEDGTPFVAIIEQKEENETKIKYLNQNQLKYMIAHTKEKPYLTIEEGE